MRKFNTTEKEFLKLIVNVSNQKLEVFLYFLQNQYFTKEQNCAVFLLHEKSEILLFIKKPIFDNIELRKEELKNFIEILSLTGYLKQNRLIDVFNVGISDKTTLSSIYSDFDNIVENKISKNLLLNQKGDHLKFPDFSKIYDINDNVIFEAVRLEKYIYDMIMNNFSGLLFVSEDLKQFVKNNYKSTEDIRYSKSQRAIWVSIFLALIFGIIGIFSPFKKEPKSFKIDDKQFQEITRQLNINKTTKEKAIDKNELILDSIK